MAYVRPEYHGGKNFPEQITDEFLSCRLCRGPGMREPKILQCGHVFCLKCLEVAMGTGSNGLVSLPGRRPPYTGQHGGRPMENLCWECGVDRVGVNPCSAMCPECGLPAKIPDGGLHRLPNYLFGNNQIDRLLRRHNRFPISAPALDDVRVYNMDLKRYGPSHSAGFYTQHPAWHGWSYAK